MNNSEFVKWVKSLTADDVAGAGLKNPAVVKTVCLVLATYGDYATGTGVQPAWTTVAKEACVSRTTAHKVRDWLVTIGVLVETGKTAPVKGTAGNITIYRLGTVVHPTWTTTDESKDNSCPSRDSQLSIQEAQLSIAEPQLSTLGGHNTTLDTTSNTKEDTTSPTASAAVDSTSSLNVKEQGKARYSFKYKTGAPSLNSKGQAPIYTLDLAKHGLQGRAKVDNYALLNHGERRDLDMSARNHGATADQVRQAATYLRTGKAKGYGFLDKCTNALALAGVEINEDGW